jgi:ribosome-associated protein
MDIRKLQRVIVDGLEDVKAQNIVVFNTEHLSPLFERVIVASGTSNRQTKSLAASVRDAVKAAGDPPPRTEGEENGEWIIVDCGAAVVHVMQPAIRDYYHLEELWGDKPVRMKIDSAAPRLVRRAAANGDAHDGHGDAGPPGARGAVRRVAPAERPAFAGAPAKRAAAPAKRGATPAKRGATPAKRGAAPTKRAAPSRAASPAKRGVVRTTGVKSAATRSPRAGAAKKAPTRR